VTKSKMAIGLMKARQTGSIKFTVMTYRMYKALDFT
jgi:hypothetical protein